MEEVTITVALRSSVLPGFTINVFEDAPTWRAHPHSLTGLSNHDVACILAALGMTETAALQMVENVIAPLGLGKAKLKLTAEQSQYLRDTFPVGTSALSEPLGRLPIGDSHSFAEIAAHAFD